MLFSESRSNLIHSDFGNMWLVRYIKFLSKEVIQTTLIIYAALCLGFTVILTGGQNIDITRYRGEDVTLFCYVPVNINFSNCQWYFTQNGGEERSLTNGTRYTWSCSSSSSTWVLNEISVKNVTFNDSGIYTCGADRKKTVLTVLAKPEITVHKTNYTVVSGTNVTLECVVNANGETITSIQWEYNVNQQWIQVWKSARHFWTKQMPSLIISDVRKSDSTLYRCLASTRVGTAAGPAILLNVQTQPEITVHKTNYTSVSGTNVTLKCIVNANGEIITSIEWEYKVNQQWIRAGISEKYFWTIQMPSLVISNVQTWDSRFYRCLASTRVGTAEGPAILLNVQNLPVFYPPNEDLTGSPLEKYVVPGVSVFVCVALIALIVVVILIRRKRQKGRTDKPNLEIRSTNGQKHPSPSEKIRSGNNHAKFYVHLSGGIRKSSKNIDGNKSIRDTNIPQSNTHIDGNNIIRDTDASHVYMNINNAYAAFQQLSSTSNPSSYINEETESANTQMNKTEKLNYVELEFSSNALDENSSHGIRGVPSDTTYTEVVVFTR